MTRITCFSSQTSTGRSQSKAVKETEKQIQDLLAGLLQDVSKNYQKRWKNISLMQWCKQGRTFDFMLNDCKIRITLECSWTSNITDYNNLGILELFYRISSSILSKSHHLCKLQTMTTKFMKRRTKVLKSNIGNEHGEFLS